MMASRLLARGPKTSVQIGDWWLWLDEAAGVFRLWNGSQELYGSTPLNTLRPGLATAVRDQWSGYLGEEPPGWDVRPAADEVRYATHTGGRALMKRSLYQLLASIVALAVEKKRAAGMLVEAQLYEAAQREQTQTQTQTQFDALSSPTPSPWFRRALAFGAGVGAIMLLDRYRGR